MEFYKIKRVRTLWKVKAKKLKRRCLTWFTKKLAKYNFVMKASETNVDVNVEFESKAPTRQQNIYIQHHDGSTA